MRVEPWRKWKGWEESEERVRESGKKSNPERVMSQERISQSMWAWATLQQRGQRTHFKPISCVASLCNRLCALPQDKGRMLRALHTVCDGGPVLMGNNTGLFLRAWSRTGT